MPGPLILYPSLERDLLLLAIGKLPPQSFCVLVQSVQLAGTLVHVDL
jgi:hypothetical protein